MLRLKFVSDLYANILTSTIITDDEEKVMISRSSSKGADKCTQCVTHTHTTLF